MYGKGRNFITNFLQRAEAGGEIAVASDQFGSPTSANDLARFLLHLVHTSEYGTYHATNRGICSRYAFAEEILKMTGKQVTLQPVPTLMDELSKVRPAYAVLDNFIMSMVPVYDFPQWQDSLREYLTERGLYHAE